MSESDKRLAQLLSEELARYKSIYVPVKSSLLRRTLVRKVRCKKLHPNPNDEFCLPEVGPNYAIISKYEQQFLSPKTVGYTGGLKYSEDDEALTIERIRPDGYMILNGHHRWAAAHRIGKRRVPVKIVNLTHEEDILASLHKSSNTRRVTLDLDEVVFRNQKGAASEKQLPFPLSLRFREPLRLGVPALFRFLKRNGYDVWVYTSKYASVDYLNHYFKAYRTWVSGVVTGMSRNKGSMSSGSMEKLLRERYTVTVHIDRDTVLRVDSHTRQYQEFRLSGSPTAWSREIMDILEGFDSHEQAD